MVLKCKIMVVLLPTVYLYVVAYLIYVYVYLPAEDTQSISAYIPAH